MHSDDGHLEPYSAPLARQGRPGEIVEAGAATDDIRHLRDVHGVSYVAWALSILLCDVLLLYIASRVIKGNF